MEKTILIILVMLFSSFGKHIYRQAVGVPDTLTYLRSIVTNKANYTGQSFSVPLDSLKISIKFFSPFAANDHDKDKETYRTFSFYNPINSEEMYLAYPSLQIYWQPYVDGKISSDFYDAPKGG